VGEVVALPVGDNGTNIQGCGNKRDNHEQKEQASLRDKKLISREKQIKVENKDT